MIIVNDWVGRLGNNIIQLLNIVNIAILHEHNISFNVKHKFFDLSIIQEYFKKNTNSIKITDRYNFFYKNKIPYLNGKNAENAENAENTENVKKILNEAFLINDIIKLPENDLVIHLRSGDIFSSNPHPKYVPSPLSYYIKEINKLKYQTIHIVCEDMNNPVLTELLNIYTNSVYHKNTLENDIKIILGASNVIFSVGSFIPSLMIFSDNIKYIHPEAKKLNDLEDYYKIMIPWKNTKIQRDYILNYKY